MSKPAPIIPLGQVDPIKLLRDLVDGLKATSWSSWQTTAHFSAAQENAERYLSRLDTHEDLLASVLSAIEACGCPIKDGGGHRDGCPAPDLQRYLDLSGGRA